MNSYLPAEARTEKYADDLISYLIGKNTLGTLPQQVADAVQQWCTENRMRLTNRNEGKFKVMHLNGKSSAPSPQIVLGQSLLEVVPNYKYLGIDVNTRVSTANCSGTKCTAPSDQLSI